MWTVLAEPRGASDGVWRGGRPTKGGRRGLGASPAARLAGCALASAFACISGCSCADEGGPPEGSDSARAALTGDDAARATASVEAARLDAAPAASGSTGDPSATDPRAEALHTAEALAAPTRARFVPLSYERRDDPLWLSFAFDGGQRFGAWLEVLELAREVRARHGVRVGFTFFVSGAYFTTKLARSTIGSAKSRDEIVVRRALVQQAIVEGHEIADHAVRHLDGSAFTRAEWDAELAEQAALVERHLFEPVLDADGEAVFPRWAPLSGAGPRTLGAACEVAGDCASGLCLRVSPRVRVCTQPCNHGRPCPSGTACGAPTFTKTTDVCVPLPALPIEHQGAVLFDAKGEPNRAHPALKPRRLEGFRAPFLGHGDALLEALAARGYRYDASFAVLPGPPVEAVLPENGRSREVRLLELGLARWEGTRTLPMDFNYHALGEGPARMRADYRKSVLAAHAAHVPWNVGHHFAALSGGAYFEVLADTVRWVARGCPESDAEGAPKGCHGAELVTLAEVAKRLEARRPSSSTSPSSSAAPPRPASSAHAPRP